MIRKATQSDVLQLALIFRLARETAMPWLPVLHTPDGDFKFFSKRVLPNETVEVYVKNDGHIAGFVSYQYDWVSQLYVHPNAWRMGIGSRLLAHPMESAKFRQLWVFEQNRAAQRFYARHGFEVVERTDGANNEEGCPDLRMEWRG